MKRQTEAETEGGRQRDRERQTEGERNALTKLVRLSCDLIKDEPH